MKKLFGSVLLLIVMATVSFGQAISVNGGSIQGSITDNTGALVPGATVVITGTDTGFTRSLTADSSGFYSVGPLNPGNYTVDVSASGFQKLSVKTVVRTGTVTSGNFKLPVGNSSETVEVNAGELQVNTEQAGVSGVITREQIESLPVNGRNFLDIAQIEPGVILQQGQSFDPTKAGYSAISVSGVSGRTTRILLDGQDVTDEFVGTTIFNVSQGAVNEFQLNRSTQDVSGDVTSTGQVLVSTQSGTNHFHGQAFYNFQDQRALFANPNGITPFTPPPFQRNQFGGSIGGPVFRDKLFFFGNAERIKQETASPAALGPLFAQTPFGQRFSTIGSPYRETYSTARLDYNGPLGGHYFVRGNYDVNAAVANFNTGYQIFANRDNTPGIAAGADFTTGRFTHSFRGSYEKFHNLIGDATGGNSSIYNPVAGLTLRYVAQSLFTGPNVNAPQGTFQSDKQFRYDGTWTKGSHIIRYGGSLNRIQSAGFAAFYGLAPRATITAGTLLNGVVSTNNPSGLGCNGVVGAAACPTDPVNGYNTSALIIGNGQGFSTEFPGFGLKGGALGDWRSAGYVSDSWKIRPTFTLTAGVRWSTDTGRANQDLNTPLCSDVDTSSSALPTGCASPTTPLFSLWRSDLGQKVHQPYGNFAPQLGFIYSPADHKTSFRGGFGLFFESVVFNNTSNARNSLLKQGAFFDFKTTVCSAYSVTLPDNSVVTSVNGVSIRDLCRARSVGQAASSFTALEQLYQRNTAANSVQANGGYVGENLTVSGLYGAPFRNPYSEQWNFGVERELFKGAVLSADYIHNSTLKIAQSVDLNHVGAARYFNQAAAQAAISATTRAANCAGGFSSAAITCAIASGAKIPNFAANGLDSGLQYLSGNPASYAGKGNAAFGGANPTLGTGSFLLPIGRSGYDALQLVYRQNTAHPVPGIEQSNLQVSYSYSRIVTTSTAGSLGSSDQFFSGVSYDNDNPSLFMGPASLDRTHQLSFGGSLRLKYGPQMGIIGHFFSAPPATLTLDNTSTSTGNIFQTDVTGDGTSGDIAPGMLAGDYMRRIKSDGLRGYINNFNATKANTLTPAGQQLVASGLFTQAQLVSIGGAIQPIAQLPQTNAINNAMFRSVDLNFSYPIRMYRLHEGLSLEPEIAFYNIGNFSNFGTFSGVLNNTTSAGGPINNNGGFYTGPNDFASLSTARTYRGSGTFSQGAPRSTEFQLKLNF